LRQSPYYWVHVHDHDVFYTQACEGNYWYTLCGVAGSGEPLYSGTWQASLPSAGEYEVSVWIPNPDAFEYEGRTYTPTQKAVYQIYYRYGSTTKVVNQSLRTGTWYSLGTFIFASSATVKLNDRTGEPYLSTMIAFDAIRFTSLAGNQPPTLSNGYVTPSSGNVATVFEYYVTYSDPEGDVPTTKYVYINGSSHTMSKISGDYVSGATFKFSGTLPTGSHIYYFYFTDSFPAHVVKLPINGTYPGPSVFAGDFSVTTSEASLSIQQGGSGSSTITVTSLDGFIHSINLVSYCALSGVTATFSPQQVMPPVDGSITSTMTVLVAATTAVGTCTLSVGANNGTLTRRTDISLEITQTAPAAKLFVQPDRIIDETLAPGNTFKMSIKVADMNNLYAYEFKLKFEYAKIQLLSSVRPAGHFLEPVDPMNAFTPVWKLDESRDSTYQVAHFGYTLLAPETARTGSGVLVELTFRVQSVGASAITIEDSKLSDTAAASIPHTIFNGYFSNAPLKFKVGDRVRTVANLNVREGPGLSYAINSTIPEGTLGQIMGGPVEADGYIWWDVNYDSDTRGWSAEDWLTNAESPPPDYPPICSIKLQKDGAEITQIDVDEFFDVYVGDSTDDVGIKQVRFSADYIPDGTRTEPWSASYGWDAIDPFFFWHPQSKRMRCQSGLSGTMEIWVEIEDTIGQKSLGVKLLIVRPRFLTLPYWEQDIIAGWMFDTQRGHYGTDFIKCSDIQDTATWKSFQVLAAADGEAFYSEEKDNQGNYKGWGYYVYIKHNEKDPEGRNYYTLYGHMRYISSMIPKEGEGTYRVQRGEIIGLCGSTGNSDPDRIGLHFEVHEGDARAGTQVGDRVDPYDLNQDRDSQYGEVASHIRCGPKYLWTTDPPYYAIVAVLTHLFSEYAIDAIPVTVEEKYYCVFELSHRLDPATLMVMPDSGPTKIYVEIAPGEEFYPVSDPDIVQKIGLTDHALKWHNGLYSPENIAEKIAQMNQRWLTYYDIEVEDAIINAIPAGINFEDLLESELFKLILQLANEIVFDPLSELKSIGDLGIARASGYYYQAMQPADYQLEDYGAALSYLQNYWKGEAEENAAFYLFDKVYEVGRSKISRIGEYLGRLILGFVTFSISDFALFVQEQGNAIDLENEYYTKLDAERKAAEGKLGTIYDVSAYTHTLDLAQSPRIVAERQSPIEFTVCDSKGRITGVVNGEEKTEIPYSVILDDAVLIYFPDDEYRYEALGVEPGTYGLTVVFVQTRTRCIFSAQDIHTTQGAAHIYTIDWAALSGGEKGVMVQVDSNGDGIVERTFTSDSELTGDEFQRTIEGDITQDGIVDIFDLVTVVIAFGSTPSTPSWDARCDLNGDSVIDVLDLAVVAINFGKESTPP
jgi:murein DD-endopeptidase MepM/ murein hydrolase activator NlpD